MDKDRLLAEAYAMLAEHHCDLKHTARFVTRAKIGEWLDKVKPILDRAP